MKDLGDMNLDELKEELKREEEWHKECVVNANLSMFQIDHLKALIKHAEGEQK